MSKPLVWELLLVSTALTAGVALAQESQDATDGSEAMDASVPVADESVYEPKEKVLAVLGEVQSRVTRAALELDDARLDVPFPEPALLDVFPTVRHALTQVLVGHTSMHVGQITVWRKAMGLPAMKRAFE